MKTILLACFTFLPLIASAQVSNIANPFPRTITVNGSAEMSITPDEIYVGVTLRDYSGKAGTPQKDLNSLIADFLAACKSLGIPDSAIGITGIGSSDNSWYWLKKSRRSLESVAEISYEIKLAGFETVEALAGKLDNIAARFRVDRLAHSTERAIRKQLKIDAVKAAREKSRYLAEAIGETAGQAVTITEPNEEAGADGFRISQRAVSNSAYSETGPVGSGGGVTARKLRYRYEVTVVFALK